MKRLAAPTIMLVMLAAASCTRVFDFSGPTPAATIASTTPEIATTSPADAGNPVKNACNALENACNVLATPQKMLAIVCVGFPEATLNVRSGPGIEYPSIGTAPEGTPLPLLSTQSDWLQVEYAPGKTGYVNRYYVCNNDRKHRK